MCQSFMCARCCEYLSFQQQLPGCDVHWQLLSFSLVLTKACKEELGTSQSFASDYKFIKENCMCYTKRLELKKQHYMKIKNKSKKFSLIYREMDFWKESRLGMDMLLLSIDKCSLLPISTLHLASLICSNKSNLEGKTVVSGWNVDLKLRQAALSYSINVSKSDLSGFELAMWCRLKLGSNNRS